MAFAFAKGLMRKNLLRTYKPNKNIICSTKRFLNLHECDAKDLLAKHGVRVQRGFIARTPKEAKDNAIKLREMGALDLIVKSQILAGGRGKGTFNTGFKGGVKVCDSPEEIEKMTKEMLGNRLVTQQTGPEGQLVEKVLIHEGVNFEKEYYLAFLLDPQYQAPVIVGSPMGGMEIEEVAEEYPDKIKTIPIDLKDGLTKSQGLEMAKFLGFSEEKHLKDAVEQMLGLYDLMMKNDCVQVEINPIVQTTEENYGGKVYCVDAKLGFDDFAAYRNKEIFALKDPGQEDPREVAAEEYGLNYVGLDGNVGCMVNGAGLAMSTMDVIYNAGGEPANFLDVGGGANEQQVEAALKILTGDKNVKGILINIFGGIMKCDVIARGVIAAAKSIDLKKLGIPLVVRLAGTNVDEGKKLLDESGLLIESASDLDDAAAKVVAAIKGK